MILAAVVLVSLWTKPKIPPAPEPAPTAATSDGMDLAIDTDPTLVFQKAFWRHPTIDDQTLHAERREWSAEEAARRENERKVGVRFSSSGSGGRRAFRMADLPTLDTATGFR